jgi:hypothetical protein
MLVWTPDTWQSLQPCFGFGDCGGAASELLAVLLCELESAMDMSAFQTAVLGTENVEVQLPSAAALVCMMALAMDQL